MRAGGISGGLQQSDEFFRRVGWRCWIVNRHEVDTPAGRCAKRNHQTEEIRIRLCVRTSKTRRDPADADVCRSGGEDPEIRELRREPWRYFQRHFRTGKL